jgi:hypothetical protein
VRRLSLRGLATARMRCESSARLSSCRLLVIHRSELRGCWVLAGGRRSRVERLSSSPGKPATHAPPARAHARAMSGLWRPPLWRIRCERGLEVGGPGKARDPRTARAHARAMSGLWRPPLWRIRCERGLEVGAVPRAAPGHVDPRECEGLGGGPAALCVAAGSGGGFRCAPELYAS